MSLPQAVLAADACQQQEGLQLDARQRAMLAEMGVRLWWPQAVDAPEALVADEVLPAAGAASARTMPSSASALGADVAYAASTQPVPALVHVRSDQVPQVAEQDVPSAPSGAARRAESQPQRPVTHAQPPVQAQIQLQIQKQAYALQGGASAPAVATQTAGGMRWLLVLDPPGLSEQAAGESAAQADVRRLLMNMMAAVRLDARQAHHLRAVQAVVAPGQMLDAAGLAPWRATLVQEIQRLQPQVLLCLGRHAAYSVLGSQAPLGQLRGQAHRMAWLAASADAGAASVAPAVSNAPIPAGADIPVVVSYPPAYLLRNPAAKRQAWQDLCMAHALAQAALPNASAESA